MDGQYVVLRSKWIGRQPEVLGPDASSSQDFTKRGPLSINSAHLTSKDVADTRKDPDVISLAYVMPLSLHEPTERTTEGLERDAETWGIRAVGADKSPYTGAGITVAVLDTGIDTAHEAFKGISIVQKDFTGEGEADTNGHGTHCAATIFGRNVGGTRIGVAPGVEKCLIGKVLGEKSSSTRSLIAAINWAFENGAQIISMSLGFNFPGLVSTLAQDYPLDLATSMGLEVYRQNILQFDALANFLRSQEPLRQGTLIIAAAGNHSRRDENPRHVIGVEPPAVARDIMSVGALVRVEDKFTVAPFSNGAPEISAPGVNIVSARNGGGLIQMTGTSMATPHVAGIAALWAEKLSRLPGRLQGQTMYHKLIGTAVSKVGEIQVVPGDTGSGIVQAPTT